MQDFLFGSWAPQLTAGIKQYPLETVTTLLIVITVVMTLISGERGSGSDPGPIFGDGDGDGGGD
jgi:hypothetical protein